MIFTVATILVGCNASEDRRDTRDSAKVQPGSGSGSATAPAVAAAPAGKVLEVSGAVTVAGKPLAVGDTVVADATIDTGADGNVVIQLLHNLARWELGPNKHVRVDQSLAWREPKHTGEVAQVEQDSTSAGQPAERMTANTAVSAVAPDEHKHDLIGSGSSGISGLGIAGQGVGGGGGGGKGLGIGTIGTIGGGTGAGYGNGAGGGGTRGSTGTVRQGTPDVQGQLAPEIIARVVKMRSPVLRHCYENGLKANPTLAGKITIKLVIGTDGNVVTVQALSDTLGDAGVTSCVINSVKRWSFPAPKDGVVIATYPFTFVPG